MPTALDYFTGQQVYLEGYKDGEAERRTTSFDEIAAVIIWLATRKGIEHLGELTRRELNQFVAQVNREIKRIFKKESKLTDKSLHDFLDSEVGIVDAVFGTANLKTPPKGQVNRKRLWSEISSAPMPGTGIEPGAIGTIMTTTILLEISRYIKRSYAERQPVKAFIQTLVGTKSLNFRDGIITKLKRQWVNLVKTTIQDISSYVSFKIGSLTHEKYTWVAVLDNRTTDICRNRNGKVYRYEDGPRPPAHWNCRSFIIPVTVVELEDIPTFYTWIKEQPSGIQDDVLGPVRGRSLRRGDLKSDDLPGFDYTKPLTLKEYENKVNQMFNEVA